MASLYSASLICSLQKQYNPEAYGVCTYVHTIRLYSTIHIHDPSHYWFVTINKHFNDNSVNN